EHASRGRRRTGLLLVGRGHQPWRAPADGCGTDSRWCWSSSAVPVQTRDDVVEVAAEADTDTGAATAATVPFPATDLARDMAGAGAFAAAPEGTDHANHGITESDDQ